MCGILYISSQKVGLSGFGISFRIPAVFLLFINMENFLDLRQADLQGKTVVIRVDFNVPIKDGVVLETTRIDESISTIQYIIKQGAARLHILSHCGRPKEIDSAFSLKPIIPVLEKHLGTSIEFCEDFSVGTSSIQLHENVRFWPGETKNDPEFVQELQKLGGEIFVNDGFAVSHRTHASVVGLTTSLPSYPGFLLQKEIEELSPFISDEKILGLTVVAGGGKISSKINILKHFARTAEIVIVAGALSNNFFKVDGYQIGKTVYEPDQLDVVDEVRRIAAENNTTLVFPIDAVCGQNLNDPNGTVHSIQAIPEDLQIWDSGPESVKKIAEICAHSKTVIWNGPLGVFENPAFANGTRDLLKALEPLNKKSIQTVLGGGDTLDAIRRFEAQKENFTHVSTGGGAMLEFLEGKALPGIEALRK